MFLKVIDLPVDKNLEIFHTENCRLLISMYEQYYKLMGFNLPWVGYFIFHDNILVGSCGFVGKANDGVVEIAYWTFKEYEGKGVAGFACSGLIAIAKKADPTLILTARTAPHFNASVKILQKQGFSFYSNAQDIEIGAAWDWRLRGADI